MNDLVKTLNLTDRWLEVWRYDTNALWFIQDIKKDKRAISKTNDKSKRNRKNSVNIACMGLVETSLKDYPYVLVVNNCN